MCSLRRLPECIRTRHTRTAMSCNYSALTLMVQQWRSWFKTWDHPFGIVVRTSFCHPRDPAFDSRLYPINISGRIGLESIAVGQEVACAPVTQRARVRSPVGTSFLGEVFSGFSSPVRQMSGSFRPPRSPSIIWPSLSSSLIIHYGRQWSEMLTHPKTSNVHTYFGLERSPDRLVRIIA